MTLQDILGAKSGDVRTIGPDATIDDCVQALVRYNVGSLIVCRPHPADEETQMIGIITERDILKCVAAHRNECGRLCVADMMTTNVITGTLNDTVGQVMGLMTDNRIRHLPIMDGERLLGIISIGDVVKAQHDEMALENHYLKNYIQS